MSKSIVDKIENLNPSPKDDYFLYLEDALKKYYRLVDEGMLIPRGNRISTIVSDADNRN